MPKKSSGDRVRRKHSASAARSSRNRAPQSAPGASAARNTSHRAAAAKSHTNKKRAKAAPLAIEASRAQKLHQLVGILKHHVEELAAWFREYGACLEDLRRAPTAPLEQFSRTLECIHNVAQGVCNESGAVGTVCPDLPVERMQGISRALHDLFVTQFPRLFGRVYTTEYNSRALTAVLPSIMVYTCATKVLLAAHRNFMSPHDPKSLCYVTATQFEYVAMHGLVCVPDKPILAYSVYELLMALWTLQSGWALLRYDDELFEYIGMLELRAAQHIQETWSAHVHNVEEMRVPAPNSPTQPGPQGTQVPLLYAHSTQLVAQYSSVFAALHTRLDQACLFPVKQCPPQWRAEPADCERLRNWICAYIEQSDGSSLQDAYRRTYLNLALYPGERELYLNMDPGQDSTPELIVKSTRGEAEKRRLQEFAGGRKKLEPMDDDPFEAPLSMPCMASVVMQQRFTTISEGHVSWGDVCLFQPDLADQCAVVARARYEPDMPLVVQRMNSFGVLFHKVHYECGTFMEAVVVFLNIIADVHRGVMPGRRAIDISDIFGAVFGAKRRQEIYTRWLRELHPYLNAPEPGSVSQTYATAMQSPYVCVDL